MIEYVVIWFLWLNLYVCNSVYVYMIYAIVEVLKVWKYKHEFHELKNKLCKFVSYHVLMMIL